jgi:hypothetical protein
MQVDMMHDQFKAMSGEHTALNCKVLQLPYSGDQVSMVLILPNDKTYFCNIVNRSLANNLLATDNVIPLFALDSILVFNVLYPMCTSLTMPVVNIDDKICFLVVPSVPIDSSNSA